MSLYDKLAADAYRVQRAFPKRPARPSVLNKVAGRLSADELAELPQAKAEYDAGMEDYSREVAAIQAEDNVLTEQFWADLNASAWTEASSPPRCGAWPGTEATPTD